MDAETFHRAIDLPPMNGDRIPAGRDASAEEMRKLFRSCREDKLHLRGMRDAAILSLAYGAGLRRTEIASATLDAFTYETRSLVITGKGNRQRIVPIPAWAAENIQGWIRLRGTDEGALISPLSLDATKLDGTAHVQGQSIYAAIRKRVKWAGVKSLTPHDFRRTLATELLDRTKDLVAVQHILGHRSPATTQVYLRGIEKQKRAAADVLADPEVA
jgi:integrase